MLLPERFCYVTDKRAVELLSHGSEKIVGALQLRMYLYLKT